MDNVLWDEQSFPKRMIELICTFEYRLNHNFPGERLTYKSYTYTPHRFNNFCFATVQYVAQRNHAHYSKEKTWERLRKAFQNSTVRPDMEKKIEMTVSPKKRTMHFSPFSTSEESEEPSKKKKRTPKKEKRERRHSAFPKKKPAETIEISDDE